MGYRLGIDLGTTFTAAATDAGGSPRMVGLGNRALQVPSVLYLKEDGTFLCGEAAERRAVDQPDRVVREFKRRLGDTVPMLVAGQPFSPQALTAKLLTWVVATATEREGEAPDEVVLTHPANWGGFKRELFGQVASLADLDRVSTCAEPEAAAIQYASRARLETGDRVVVYDLGGGTFDVCVLRMTEGGCEILGSPDGVEHLGGIDFDEAVFRHVLDSLGDQAASLDPAAPEVTAGLIRMRRDCVEAKEALSNDVDTVVPVNLPGISTSVRVTRPELETLIAPAIGETIAATRRALRSADTGTDDLAAVVLVGGSSRIPLISQRLQGELGVRTAMDTHPKHDIALGAVIHRRLDPRSGPREARAPAVSHAVASVAGWPTRDAGAPPSLAPASTPTGSSPAAPQTGSGGDGRIPPTAPAPAALGAQPAPPTSPDTTPTSRLVAPATFDESRAGLLRQVPRWGWIAAAVTVLALAGLGLVATQVDLGNDAEPTPAPPPGDVDARTAIGDDEIVVALDLLGEGPDLYVLGQGAPDPLFEADGRVRIVPALDPTRRFVYYREGDAATVDEEFDTRVLDLESGESTEMIDAEEEEGIECVGRPTWLPDTTTVALLCRENEQVFIFRGEQAADGQIGSLEQVPGLDNGWLNVSYLGTGDMVAARGPKSSRYGLLVIGDAGEQRLVSGEAGEPAASPFDERILYVADRALHLVHADGSEPDCPGEDLIRDPVEDTPICRLTEPGEAFDGRPTWEEATLGEPDRALFVRAQTAEEPVGELLLLDLAEGGEPERFSEQIGQVNGPPAWAHR